MLSFADEGKTENKKKLEKNLWSKNEGQQTTQLE
jgi:hypothetical protein